MRPLFRLIPLLFLLVTLSNCDDAEPRDNSSLRIPEIPEEPPELLVPKSEVLQHVNEISFISQEQGFTAFWGRSKLDYYIREIEDTQSFDANLAGFLNGFLGDLANIAYRTAIQLDAMPENKSSGIAIITVQEWSDVDKDLPDVRERFGYETLTSDISDIEKCTVLIKAGTISAPGHWLDGRFAPTEAAIILERSNKQAQITKNQKRCLKKGFFGILGFTGNAKTYPSILNPDFDSADLSDHDKSAILLASRYKFPPGYTPQEFAGVLDILERANWE